MGLLQADWQVLQGSILDRSFLDTLPRGDCVYSYGVLFHTGDVWRAVTNIASLVGSQGHLFFGLHAKEADDGYREDWRVYKRQFNHMPTWMQELPRAWTGEWGTSPLLISSWP